MKRNIAVIGSGQWGKNLIRNFNELSVLSSICDLDYEIASSLAEKYKVKNNSFVQILDDPNIKGVALAVPAELHASMAINAMNKGKHVFVEKPLAMNIAEADLMIKTAKKNNVQLMVGHLLQYHPIFIAILKMVKNGDIGQLNHIYSNRLSFGRVRSNEDVIWSFAPHDISMILSLADEDPEDVKCQSRSILQKNLADMATIQMKFKSGLTSEIKVSWLNPEKEVKLVIYGKNGIIVFDDTKTWDKKLSFCLYELQNSKKLIRLEKSKEQYVKVIEKEPLKNECEHFVSVVEKNLKPYTDGTDGLRVLKVLTSISLVKQNSESA